MTVDVANSEAVDAIQANTGQHVQASIILAEHQSALDLAAGITKKHGTICLVAAVGLSCGACTVRLTVAAEATLASLAFMDDSQGLETHWCARASDTGLHIS